MIGLLLENQALQEELGLAPEQKAELQNLSRASRDKQRDLFRNAFGQQGGRGQGGQGGQRGQGGQGGGRGGFDPERMQQMQQAMMAMQQENEAAIGEIIGPKQRKRLEEIRLRIIGPTAVAEEKVAMNLGLAEEQFEQIQGIMADYDMQAGDLMRRNFEAMRGQGGFGGPGGPGGQRGQAGPGGQRGQAGQGGQGGQRGQGERETAEQRQQRMREYMESPEFKEAQERMAKMQEEEAQLLKRAESAIGKVLSSGQKRKFNAALGADFDLTKLVQTPQGRGPGGRGPGGPGGDDGDDAGPGPGGPPQAGPDDGDDSAADTATPRGTRTRIPPRVRGFSSGEN